MDLYPEALTLLASSTTLANLIIVNEEKRERPFHTQIWVKDNPLHLIMDDVVKIIFSLKTL
jgi:hypothetical protein